MPINVAAFNGAEKVTVPKGIKDKPYPAVGDYLYRIDTFRCKQTRKGIDLMAAEFTTVHIFKTEEGKASHPIGEEVCKISLQSSDYYVKDIKAVLTAATGCSDNQIGQEEILESFGFDSKGNELPDGPPLDGQYITIKVSTFELEKKDKPGEFYTITNFERAYSPEELLNILSDEVIEKYYTDEEGNNVLEAMLA